MSNNESNDAKTMTELILELIDGLMAIALSGKGGSLRAMSLKGGYPDTRTDPKSKDVSDIKVSKAKSGGTMSQHNACGQDDKFFMPVPFG